MVEFIRDGGPFMFLLVITSLVAVTFIIERGWALRWKRVIPSSVESAVENCREEKDLAMLRRVCEQDASPLSRLLLTAADHLHWPKGENADAIETRARHEVMKLERGLVILEIIVGIAPLLGLVGTIHGLTVLFGDMGRIGLGDNAAMAKGIAIALNTTLTGLLIAIPAMIAWSYYSKKVETLAVEMETLCDGFLRRLYPHEKDSK